VNSRLSESQIGVIQVILASFGFGFLGIFSKYAFQLGFDVGHILVARFSLAAIFLFLILILYKPVHLKISWSQLFLSLALGIFGYALFATFYFKSLQGLSVSLASLLLYTYPLWVFLINFIFGYRSNRFILGTQFLSLCGLLLILIGQIAVRSNDALFFGLASGLSYAIYILVSQKYQQNVNPIASSFWIILGASVGLVVLNKPDLKFFTELQLWMWWPALALAFVCTLGPLLLIQSALQKISSNQVAQLSLLEPLTAVVLSTLVLHEQLTYLQSIGSILLGLGLWLSRPRS
jgi:drug/metabolite transporter (DMT)-like permease